MKKGKPHIKYISDGSERKVVFQKRRTKMVLAALDTVIKTHAIINLQISDAYGNHAIHYNSQLSGPKGKLKQKQNSTKSQKIITINTEDYKDIKKYGLSHYQHVEPKQLPSKKEKIPVLKRGPRLKIKKPLSSDSDEYVPPKIVAKSFEEEKESIEGEKLESQQESAHVKKRSITTGSTFKDKLRNKMSGLTVEIPDSNKGLERSEQLQNRRYENEDASPWPNQDLFKNSPIEDPDRLKDGDFDSGFAQQTEGDIPPINNVKNTSYTRNTIDSSNRSMGGEMHLIYDGGREWRGRTRESRGIGVGRKESEEKKGYEEAVCTCKGSEWKYPYGEYSRQALEGQRVKQQHNQTQRFPADRPLHHLHTPTKGNSTSQMYMDPTANNYRGMPMKRRVPMEKIRDGSGERMGYRENSEDVSRYRGGWNCVDDVEAGRAGNRGGRDINIDNGGVFYVADSSKYDIYRAPVPPYNWEYSQQLTDCPPPYMEGSRRGLGTYILGGVPGGIPGGQPGGQPLNMNNMKYMKYMSNMSHMNNMSNMNNMNHMNNMSNNINSNNNNMNMNNYNNNNNNNMNTNNNSNNVINKPPPYHPPQLPQPPYHPPQPPQPPYHPPQPPQPPYQPPQPPQPPIKKKERKETTGYYPSNNINPPNSGMGLPSGLHNPSGHFTLDFNSPLDNNQISHSFLAPPSENFLPNSFYYAPVSSLSPHNPSKNIFDIPPQNNNHKTNNNNNNNYPQEEDGK